MDYKFFVQFGLTEGESKVYLALLSIGETTISNLVHISKMQKSSVYFCLERLLSKGLANFILKNNKKHFQASPPNRLFGLLDSKEKEIELQRKELGTMMPQMLTLGSNAKKVQNVKFFTGWNGMKTAFDDILSTLKEGDMYYVFGVATVPSVFLRFRRFIGSFHRKRSAKGIILRILVNEENRGTIGADRKKEKPVKVKFLSKEFITPAVINVYGDKTLIAIWIDEPAAIMIENKSSADSFRNYFKLLWKNASE